MKIASLKNRKDFVNIATSGKKAVAKGLLLQVLQNEQQPPEYIRLGFTTSKKLGNAVIRNRIKRKLRAVVSKVMPDRAKNSHDYVVIGRRAALDRGFDELVKDLKFALHSTETHI
jgi:ribonuclease P protein component